MASDAISAACRAGSARHLGLRTLALLAALALVLAACPEDDPVIDDPADDEEAASVELLEPAAGEEVEQPFEVAFAVDGVEIGPTETGEHHLHFYVDDGDFMPHESTDPFTISGEEPGEREIRVELARANHDEIGVGDTVTVTIAGEPDEVDDEDEAEPY